MGNTVSSVPTRGNVTGESETEMASTSDNNLENQEFHDAIDEIDDREERVKAKEAEMEEFRKQLKVKREQRREILDRHKAEKRELEVCLDNEKKAKLEAYKSNRQLRELLIQNSIELPEDLQSHKENSDISETIINMKEEFDKLKSQNNKLRRDLADANVTLQGAYSDIADLQMQNTESMKQINALKEVVSVTKTMLGLREKQLGELKDKLSEIERSLADREANMLSADLRQEYERQLQNIRALRTLYEERARLAEVTRQGLLRELEEQKELKQAEIEKAKELSTKVQDLETRVDELQEIISNKNNQIYTCQDETRGLKAEMSAVNKLFSQVLLGYKSQQDLDKLVHRLEENHGILTHMAENENDSEASTALPKLLLEIVSQVDEGEAKHADEAKTEEELTAAAENKTEDIENPGNTTAEEIVQNLPKVWRVLIELLSHQAASTSDDNVAEKVTTCYKTVETKSGPVLVPSVSQTYIRLKDLIVEKLGLVKEVYRMKQLNAHLETRLEEQEKRLCLVTNELSKTWHVVGRLRRHHHQLHTHEKILKYELQQKRKLLNELKEELEYCREKWDQAREKNTQSEKDWKKLRAEFSGRKTKSSTSFNNSAESGYSDERPSEESSESNDESEYVTEPLARSKKKLKKSFETILDSSTDRNLAAEREDPASDMLDVADLPLDTHDDDHHDISDSCNSESLLKSERVCETEDEVGDITHDSCTEDHSAAEKSQGIDLPNENKAIEMPSVSGETQFNVPNIDPAAILQSIREQNERLAKKDKKLEKLEKSGAALLLHTQTTVRISDQINSTLDHLLNRPSSSKQVDERNPLANPTKDDVTTNKATPENMKNNYAEIVNETITTLNDEPEIVEKIESNIKITDTEDTPTTADNVITKPICQTEPTLSGDPSSSIEVASVDSLQKLEKECSEVLNNISETLLVEEEIIETLDNLNTYCDESSTSNDSRLKSDSSVEIENPEVKTECLKDECLTTNLEIKTIYSKPEEYVKPLIDNKSITDEPSTSCVQIPTVDFKSILENVKKQNEYLARKDERLEKLEEGCLEVVENITKTLTTGGKLEEKMDRLHNAKVENKTDDPMKDSSNSSSRGDSSEPSTSSEVDHEALFAARDLRLKRLEEQTKSLVSKVNKTTDKGIKIHYKLEELHNIYGSENSRASTPLDDDDDEVTEEKSNEKESENNDEKS